MTDEKNQTFAYLKVFLNAQTEFDEADFSAYLTEKKLINSGESWEDLPLEKFEQFSEDYLEEVENESGTSTKFILKEDILNEVIRSKNAKILTPIEFYRENEEYGWLSNFYEHEFEASLPELNSDGDIFDNDENYERQENWSTAEHFYHAASFHLYCHSNYAGEKESIIQQIREAATPHDALAIKQANENKLDRGAFFGRDEWGAEKDNKSGRVRLMRHALFKKFDNNEMLGKLASTAQRVLIENTAIANQPANRNGFWGNGKSLENGQERNAENWLGKILMEIRSLGIVEKKRYYSDSEVGDKFDNSLEDGLFWPFYTKKRMDEITRDIPDYKSPEVAKKISQEISELETRLLEKLKSIEEQFNEKEKEFRKTENFIKDIEERLKNYGISSAELNNWLDKEVHKNLYETSRAFPSGINWKDFIELNKRR